MYNLVAIDLDGTLLDSSSTVDAETVKYLQHLIGQGVTIIIATGRTWVGAQKALSGQISANLPLLCYNGALVLSPQGKVVYDHRINLALARELMRFLQGRQVYYKTYVDDIMYVPWLNAEAHEFMVRHGVLGVSKPSIIGELQIAPNMLVVIEDEAICDSVEAELRHGWGQQVELTRSSRRSLEVLPLGVNKGWALQEYATALGLGPQHCVALGNEANDCEMLRWAAVGVAMANSPAQVQQYADWVTESNDHQGVLRALQQIFETRSYHVCAGSAG